MLSDYSAGYSGRTFCDYQCRMPSTEQEPQIPKESTNKFEGYCEILIMLKDFNRKSATRNAFAKSYLIFIHNFFTDAVL